LSKGLGRRSRKSLAIIIKRRRITRKSVETKRSKSSCISRKIQKERTKRNKEQD